MENAKEREWGWCYTIYAIIQNTLKWECRSRSLQVPCCVGHKRTS